MPWSHVPDDVSICWAALADSIRRLIINLLDETLRRISELSEYSDVSRFAVIKHLKVLEQTDPVKVEREGRKRWNLLSADLAFSPRSKLADNDVCSRRWHMLLNQHLKPFVQKAIPHLHNP